jgi:hypothetical protein
MNETERDREVGRWLEYARQDLLAARALAANPDIEPRQIC